MGVPGRPAIAARVVVAKEMEPPTTLSAYPGLAGAGLFWIKAGPCRISYKLGVGQSGFSAEITGLFYDRSNIPGAV